MRFLAVISFVNTNGLTAKTLAHPSSIGLFCLLGVITWKGYGGPILQS